MLCVWQIGPINNRNWLNIQYLSLYRLFICIYTGRCMSCTFCSVEVSSFTVVLQIISLPTWQLTDRKGNFTNLCNFRTQLNWLDWSRSRSRCQSRSVWSRYHNSFLVSVLVSHTLVSILALTSLCSGLINKPYNLSVLISAPVTICILQNKLE